MNYFNNKRVLVTGVCGTVGGELVRQLLLKYKVGELTGIDNNESELFFLDQKYNNYKNTNLLLADIRDKEKLIRVMRGIDIVFHAAAYKHVALCEKSPYEAIQTNILGVRNIVLASSEAGVEKVIFTSSDKAVNPTNVMGTSKLMGERLITAANSGYRDCNTIFVSTRFGNVLGSRGSVIPIFRDQIKAGNSITLTDPKMTRFIMSIKQAIELVVDSATFAVGGEVFVTKMPVIRISDLAEVMKAELAPQYGYDPEDIEVKVIGSKPGEKVYEELMTDEETVRAIELERYFCVQPAYEPYYRESDYTYSGALSTTLDQAYNSANEQALSRHDLKTFLNENDLLEGDKSP